MDKPVENVPLVVSWLRDGKPGQKYQAALAMRGLASNPGNKKAIREAGGIQGLLENLEGPPNNSMTVVSAETISCLIADDLENRKHLRESDGVGKLVKLLANGAECESTHRALLALRILTDREEDRVAIMEADGFGALVRLLRSGADSEITEYAAAALGNIAAGSQGVKNALREAGAIPPLLRLLREDPEEISAELAVVVLRNLSLQNPVNRKEIQDRGGLNPLLQMLSNGLDILRYPLPCRAEYFASKTGDPPFKKMICSGQCCFDPQHGHLCISATQPSRVGCFGPGKNMNPRGFVGELRQQNKSIRGFNPSDVGKTWHGLRLQPVCIISLRAVDGDTAMNKKAERFSLLRKLSIVEPNSQTLELNFLVGDKQGVLRATRSNKIATKSCQRLFRVTIYPCAATEIKGGIMRMLTRIHMEREFGVEPTLC